MKIILKGVGIAVLSLTMIMCGGRNVDSGTHTFRSFREEGIRIAETGIGPKYEGELFTYEPVLQLKQVPEEPDSYLRYPGGFWRGEDGFYYVRDSGNHRIAVFDADGNYVRAFGQDGEGPGDLRSFTIQALTGDRLDIFDYSLNRLTRYRTDGTLLDVMQLPRSTESRNAYHLLPDGRQIVFEFISPWIRAPKKSVWHRVLVLDAADDTLAVMESEHVARSFLHGPSLSAGTPIPYAPSPVSAYVPGTGILLSGGEEPVLHWYDLDGRKVRENRLTVPPDVVSTELRREIEARYDRGVERATGPAREFLKQQRDGLIIPEVKGWWTDVVIDTDGYLWLSKASTIWEHDLPTALRVLSPDGEYLGDTIWPAGRARIQDGMLMGTVEDEETGEVVPTVFLIVSNVAGFKYP